MVVDSTERSTEEIIWGKEKTEGIRKKKAEKKSKADSNRLLAWQEGDGRQKASP